ncbi:hypothetical protein KKG46_00030 [Patescibacteria group bacterium]|nr:hypothetical protein [Patescibacteria group bacterium]
MKAINLFAFLAILFCTGQGCAHKNQSTEFYTSRPQALEHSNFFLNQKSDSFDIRNKQSKNEINIDNFATEPSELDN